MASVSIRGIGVDITEAMREHAQTVLDKLFERNTPISHEVVVRALPKAKISLSLGFQCAEGQFNVSRTVDATAFYSGLVDASKVISSQIEKSRGQMSMRRHGAVEPGADKECVDVEDDDSGGYEDVA